MREVASIGVVLLAAIFLPACASSQERHSQSTDALDGLPFPRLPSLNIGTVRLWSNYTLTTLVFSHKGDVLASSDELGTIRLWNTETGDQLSEVQGGARSVRCLLFSSDDSILVSIDIAGKVRIWKTPKLDHVMDIDALAKGPRALAFVGASVCVVFVNAEGDLCKCDLLKGEGVQAVSNAFSSVLLQATEVAISIDGDLLTVLDSSLNPRSYSVKELKELGNGPMRRTRITHMLCNDANRLVTSSGTTGRLVKVWDLKTETCLTSMVANGEVLTASSAIMGGALLIVTNREIMINEAKTGALLNKVCPLSGRDTTAATISQDASRLALSDDKGFIHIYEVLTRQWKEFPRSHGDSIQGVAYSPDGRWIVTACRDGTLRKWNVRNGQLIGSSTLPLGATPEAMAWLGSTGNLCVGASGDSSRLGLFILDANLSLISDIGTMVSEESSKSVLCLGSVPDSRFVLSTGMDGFIYVWDTIKRSKQGKLGAGDGRILSLDISSDGRLIVAGKDDGSVQVWDLTRMELVTSLPRAGSAVSSIRFLPNTRAVVSGTMDGHLSYWDLSGGPVLIRTLLTSSGIRSVAISPNGYFLAIGCEDGSVSIRDAAIGEEITSLPGNGGAISSIAFSANGWNFAAGGCSQTVLGWSLLPHLDARADGKVKDIESAWEALGKNDPKRAYTALVVLAKGGDEVASFVEGRLFRQADESVVTGLIDQLDDDDIGAREAATKKLLLLDTSCENILRESLSRNGGERRARIETILRRMETRIQCTESAIRRMRAFLVLEGIGSARSKGLLCERARNSISLIERRLAQESLKRLESSVTENK